MKKSIIATIILTVLVIVAGFVGIKNCKKVDEDVVPTLERIVIPKTVILEVKPTEKPKKVEKEKIISRSNLRISKDMPEAIPDYYSIIDIGEVDYPIFAFTNDQGHTEYRVYGEIDVLENNQVKDTLVGYYPIELEGTEAGIKMIVDNEHDPINMETNLASFIACDVPTKESVRKQIQDRKNALSKYERAKAKAEKDGSEAPLEPIFDKPIFDENTHYYRLPGQFRKIRKIYNLYYYVNLYNQEEFRQYATVTGDEHGFVLSDEEGHIKDGELFVDIENDAVKANFKGRKVVEPPAFKRVPVLIDLSGTKYQAWKIITN